MLLNKTHNPILFKGAKDLNLDTTLELTHGNIKIIHSQGNVN